MIAGSDTTASTITAALFLLHEPRHTAALSRAREEVADVDVLSLALEDIKDALPYLTGVAREVLRLYPLRTRTLTLTLTPTRTSTPTATATTP